MSRKEQAVSVAAQANAVRAAGKPINPPSSVPLDDRDMPFFANVIEEFARSEWTPHQLELAAMLARTLSDLEAEQRQMRAEGSVLTTERGTPVVNPRKTVIQMHAGTILSFRRSLQLHARAHNGEARDAAKTRGTLMSHEAGVAYDDDGLLARPS